MTVDDDRDTAAEPQIIDVPSRALGRSLPVAVFTPLEGRSGDRRYPVSYLLHGVNDQPLTAAGLHALYRDPATLAAIATHHRRILVCPIVGRSWYIDSPLEPGNAFATYVGEELPAAIDARLPTIAERSARSLLGFSMGGYGAISLLCRHPDTFGAAGSRGGALDPAFGIHDLHWDESLCPHVLGSYWSERERHHRHSCFNLVNRIKDRSDVCIALDLGTEDPTIHCNRRFREQLQRLGIRHSYTETPDGHRLDPQAYPRLLAAMASMQADGDAPGVSD